MRTFATAISPNLNRRPGSRSRASRRGFTLIELLSVMVIIGIMASLSFSFAPSLLQSNRFTKNILTLSGIMDMARQHAITHNTYVWVAFTDATSEGVYVAVIESREGTNGLVDPISGNWENSGKRLSDPAYANLGLLRKVQLISNLTLPEASTLSVPGIPSTAGSVQSMQSIKLLIPVGGSDRTFTRSIQFTPTGEAKVSTSSNFVEIGIAPSSAAPNNPNVAVLRLAGITGKLTVYRSN